jgi:hypothetical protein
MNPATIRIDKEIRDIIEKRPVSRKHAARGVESRASRRPAFST